MSKDRQKQQFFESEKFKRLPRRERRKIMKENGMFKKARAK